ncbi:MAG: cytochrome c [Chloroflexi bacterium]|nr:cytochrome c [Chloroflexota bacterium]
MTPRPRRARAGCLLAPFAIVLLACTGSDAPSGLAAASPTGSGASSATAGAPMAAVVPEMLPTATATPTSIPFAAPPPPTPILEPTAAPPRPTATPLPQIAAPPPEPAPPPAVAIGDPGAGRTLFLTVGCSGCHGPDAGGDFGPRIASTTLAFQEVLSQVRRPRNMMTAFDPSVLSDQQVRDIYAFLKGLP